MIKKNTLLIFSLGALFLINASCSLAMQEPDSKNTLIRNLESNNISQAIKSLRETITEIAERNENPNQIIKYYDPISARYGQRKLLQYDLLQIATNLLCDEAVTKLLQMNVNPDFVNHDGETALHLAVKKGNQNIVSLLLENNANPNLKNNQGQLALGDLIHGYAKSRQHRYLFSPHLNLLEIFLKNTKTDLWQQDGDKSLFHCAIASKEPIILEKFLAHQNIDQEQALSLLKDAIFYAETTNTSDAETTNKSLEIVKILLGHVNTIPLEYAKYWANLTKDRRVIDLCSNHLANQAGNTQKSYDRQNGRFAGLFKLIKSPFRFVFVCLENTSLLAKLKTLQNYITGKSFFRWLFSLKG